MIKSVEYYHNAVNSFVREDKTTSKYNNYQHTINLFCFLKNLYNNVKSEFDITINNIDVLRYFNYMLNETQKRLYYFGKLTGEIK